MKKLFVIAIIAVAAWYFLKKKEAGTGTKSKSNLLKSGVFEFLAPDPASAFDTSSTTTSSTTTSSTTTSSTTTSSPAESPSGSTSGDTPPAADGALTSVFSSYNKPKSAFQ